MVKPEKEIVQREFEHTVHKNLPKKQSKSSISAQLTKASKLVRTATQNIPKLQVSGYMTKGFIKNEKSAIEYLINDLKTYSDKLVLKKETPQVPTKNVSCRLCGKLFYSEEEKSRHFK